MTKPRERNLEKMMPSKNVLFVLGAYSDEVVMIKKLLKAADMSYTYAIRNDRLATRRNAYSADSMRSPAKPGQGVVFVDCKVKGISPQRVIAALSEDPALDLGSPEFYWGSSAVGQLVSALISDPDFGGGRAVAELLAPMMWEARMAAASEYYLSDAYRGRCPGVNPTALRLWRAMNKAEGTEISARTLMDQTDDAITKLATLPVLELAKGVEVRIVDAYIPEMYEAAAMTGTTLMYSRFEKKKQKTLVTLINGTPAIIESWVAWAKSSDSGLTDVYASTVKGYAGGYKA
jgi:hypothetical protein